jgi:periplasmic copper chaperone A
VSSIASGARRLPIVAALAALVAAAGIAGLIRGAVPQSSSAGQPVAVATLNPIAITGAYVREPASPGDAAAYLTITNNTDRDDTLLSVASGAGAKAEIHIDSSMTQSATGLRIPAHSSVTLVPGKSHIMLEELYGPLSAGQTVNIELIFANQGGIVVTAPVIGVLAPTPSAGTR